MVIIMKKIVTMIMMIPLRNLLTTFCGSTWYNSPRVFLWSMTMFLTIALTSPSVKILIIITVTMNDDDVMMMMMMMMMM